VPALRAAPFFIWKNTGFVRFFPIEIPAKKE